MRAFLITLIALCFAACYGQQPFTRHQWLNEAHTSVKTTALVQTPDGYIWLGTDQGLYRYNGVVYTRMAAPSPNIIGISALGYYNGSLIAASGNGSLFTIRHDSLVQYALPGYRESGSVKQIKVKANELWLATEAGLVRHKGGSTQRFTTASGLSDDFIYSIAFDEGGTILAGTDRGINMLQPAGNGYRIRTLNTMAGLPDNITRVLCRLGTTRKYLAGTLDGGIAIYNAVNGTIDTSISDTSQYFGQVNDIYSVSNSSAIAATEQGYILFITWTPGGRLTLKSTRLEDRNAYALLQDRSGNIWCGTNTGMSLLTANYLNYIDLPAPYKLNDITSLCSTRDGFLWLGIQNALYRLDSNHTLLLMHHFDAIVSALHADKQDRLWVGTLGSGLYYIPAGGGKLCKLSDSMLASESILSISASQENIWVAGLNGLKQLALPDATGQIPSVVSISKTSGSGSDYIYQLFTDSRQSLWLATDGAGIRSRQNGRFVHWSTVDSGGNNVAYCIEEDASGNIWAGFLHNDLYRFSQGRWQRMRKEQRDIDANIATLEANKSGQVFAVYKRCIDVWYPQSHTFRHFNYRSGIGIDTTSTVLNCGTSDITGNVYLPFERGILVFGNQDSSFDISPGLHLLSVRNATGIIPDEKKVFDADDNYFSFTFDGISFVNPERLQYRYRLKGYNHDWIYTREPAATFARLTPGNYVFEAQVSLSSNFDYSKTITYSFRINKPFWQRGWFIVLAILLVLLLLYFYIRYREKNLRKVSQLERERILFEYEHLKTQINPHFLFNSLNTLASLIEEDTHRAVDYTTNLSDLYRELLIHRDKNLIPLKTEWEILGAYLHIQKSRFGKALHIDAEIPEHLMLSKKIVPIALQLLVENAIKHNVVSIHHPLHIYITADENEIKIVNNIKPKLTPEPSSGVGLENIKRRYGLITQRPVSYGAENGTWVVILPLL